MSNCEITSIAGSRVFRIPIVGGALESTLQPGIKGPEWMVRIDDFLESDVDKFETYVELFGWYGESSRVSSSLAGSHPFPSATIRHSDLVLLIPNGGYAAKLETCMNKGASLGIVEIIRLGHVQTSKVVLQRLEYGTCHIQVFQQQLDRLVLFLNITTKTNTVIVYDIEGNIKGQVVSKVDYSGGSVG